MNALEESSKKYIGIDISNEQLKKAKAKSKKNTSQFICSNLSEINLKDNTVDLIVSSWVLGTIVDLDERERCLNELKRVLKPNGIIILIENDLGGEFEEIRNRTKDNRTLDYNNWILGNGFKVEKRIKTFFDFKSIDIARKCLNIIYGNDIVSKIKNRIVKHNIIIFKYSKTE